MAARNLSHHFQHPAFLQIRPQASVGLPGTNTPFINPHLRESFKSATLQKIANYP